MATNTAPAEAGTTLGTLTPRFRVTPAALDYLLTTAFEGGSNYWIDGGVGLARGEKQASPEFSKCLAEYGQTLLIHHANTKQDNGKLETARLTLEMLLAGLTLYLENGGTSGVLLLNPNQDCGDAGDADMILQYALFGKIIFG